MSRAIICMMVATTLLLSLSGCKKIMDDDEYTRAILSRQEPPKTIDLTDLSGTWNVVSKDLPQEGNCGFPEGDTTVYQWLLGQNSKTGELTVQVIGKTSFPNLTGTITEGWVRLDGYSKESVRGEWFSSFFVLKATEKGLEGKRYFVGVTKKDLACMSVDEVTVTKQ
jgi:hypothetical protein